MNPFKYGQVVSAENFCPRPELLKGLVAFIKSRQNVVLQGERRMGKTSLIYEALRQVKRQRMVYVDLLEIKTVDDLGKRIAKAIISSEQQAGMLEKVLRQLSQLRPVISVDPFTGEPGVTLDSRIMLQADSLGAILDLIQDTGRRHAMVVVFDEFQDILNLSDSNQVLAILRSNIQFHDKITYIFAGSIRNRMSEIFTSHDSPFFKSTAALDVGPLTGDKFSKFLKAKFSKGSRTINKEMLSEIIIMAENVPGDVQQLCGALWDTTSTNERVSREHLAPALELIFSRESKGYESVLVLLTGQQLKCLIGLARMGGKSPLSAGFLEGAGITLPASVKKALGRLIQLKVIYRYQGEYKFINPFFKRWIVWKNY